MDPLPGRIRAMKNSAFHIVTGLALGGLAFLGIYALEAANRDLMEAEFMLKCVHDFGVEPAECHAIMNGADPKPYEDGC